MKFVHTNHQVQYVLPFLPTVGGQTKASRKRRELLLVDSVSILKLLALRIVTTFKTRPESLGAGFLRKNLSGRCPSLAHVRVSPRGASEQTVAAHPKTFPSVSSPRAAFTVGNDDGAPARCSL